MDPIERRRQQLRDLARRLRRAPAAHHRHYEAHLRDALPLGRGSHPDAVIDLVEASGWRHPEIVRLRDVEWARALATPAPERLVGPTPVYVVTAR